jgi:O-antigen/teichoic acid export membrane protein
MSDGLSLVFYLALARKFGESGLGDYSLAFALATLAGLGIEFGLRALVTRRIARNPELASHYWGTLVVLQVGLTVVIGLMLHLWSVVAGYSHELYFLVATAFLGMALRAFGLSFVAFLEAVEAMDKSAILEFAARFASVACGLALIGVGARLQIVMLAHVIGGAAYLGLAVHWVRQRFGPLTFLVDLGLVKRTLLAALPFVGASLLYEVYARADIILLHQLVGETATGQYAAAIRLIVTPLAAVFLVGVAIYPKLSQSGDTDTAEGANLFLSTLKWLSILGMSGAVILVSVGDKVLIMLFGQGFADAGDLVRWMAILFFSGSVKVPYERLLFARDRERTQLRLQALSVVLNLVLTLLLIPAWGVYGAVWASMVSEISLILGLHLSCTKFVRARYIPMASKLLLAAGSAALVGMLVRDLVVWPLAAVLAWLTFLGVATLLRILTMDDRRRFTAALNGLRM